MTGKYIKIITQTVSFCFIPIRIGPERYSSLHGIIFNLIKISNRDLCKNQATLIQVFVSKKTVIWPKWTVNFVSGPWSTNWTKMTVTDRTWSQWTQKYQNYPRLNKIFAQLSGISLADFTLNNFYFCIKLVFSYSVMQLPDIIVLQTFFWHFGTIDIFHSSDILNPK